MTPGGCCSGSGGSANLEIYQGDDYLGTVTVMNGNQPADLTGFTANAQIRRDVADNDPIVDCEITTEIVAPNLVLLSISHDQTVQLSGNYVWDLELVTPDGAIETILTGAVTVTSEVTREASYRRNDKRLLAAK